MKILVEGQVTIRKQQVLVEGFYFDGDPDDPRSVDETIQDWITKQIRESLLRPFLRERLAIEASCFGGREGVFTKAELLEAIENLQKEKKP